MSKGTSRIAAALCLLLAACGGSGTSQPEQRSRFGKVGLALAAPGASGVRYRLPAGTRLNLFNETYYDSANLDGDAVSIEVTVPTGSYGARLRHSAGYTTTWPLDAYRAGETTPSRTISATLVTPMPVAVDVLEGAVAPLVFEFRAPQGEPITFRHGQVSVSIDVDEVPATGTQLAAGSSATVEFAETDPSAPAALAARLPAAGATPGIAISARVGAWLPVARDAVCAPLQALSVTGTGHTGFADLAAETAVPAGTSSSTVCVSRSPAGTVFLTVQPWRDGAPTKPTFTDLGASELSFSLWVQAVVPAAVWDGSVLDLSLIDGRTPLAMEGGALVATFEGAIWYQAAFTGGVTFTFTPT